MNNETITNKVKPKVARELQNIAADLLEYATDYEPHVLLAGRLTAAELARLARFVDSLAKGTVVV